MKRITRHRFLRHGLTVGGVLALPWAAHIPAARAAPGGKLSDLMQLATVTS